MGQQISGTDALCVVTQGVDECWHATESVGLQSVMKGATPCETGAGAVPAPVAMAAACGGEAAELLEAAGELVAGAVMVACCMDARQNPQ